ncbi:MAG TPA: efflux RND transporter periplasmic adaptor subunit [Acidobacteriaceae bacterium]|jgi:HlyD family secretion protein|nr:efflux RND transporter periplasmic adaptor subunit [Acidobacteriaceae bacterium]
MAIPKRSRRRSRWIWLAVIVGLAVLFYFVRMATRSRVPVRTAIVQRSDVKKEIPTNGKVEPQVNFEAHAPYPGSIKALYVHEGEQVPKDKLLLAMYDDNASARMATALAGLRNAQANYNAMLAGGTQQQRLTLSGELAKAKIEHDQAQRDLEALQKLESTGAASANEVASAQQRLEAANASLTNLQQRKTNSFSAGDLARAKAAIADAQATYAAAKQTVEEANIRAPFAGTVYSLPVSTTEYVNQGDLLLQMADLSKMQVRAYFDEPEIGQLRVGQPVTIQWDAKPGRSWHGHIARVPSTIITYTTRNVGEVLVKIDDADNDLLPNTNVRVIALVANVLNALNIPREALHSENGQPYVYRVEDGIVRRVNVKTGNVNLTQVEILGGLKEGEVVALSSTNGQPIGDGVPITEAK